MAARVSSIGRVNCCVVNRNATTTTDIVATRIRPALLALVAIGIVGLIAELLLIEHFDETWQIVPLVVLGVALIGTIAIWRWPTVGTVRFFQATMIAFIIVGVLGLWRHYVGNVEWELERQASLRGIRLFWESMRGATPILAPGALAQLGLLGLVYTFRHPALSRDRPTPSGDQR